MVDAVVADETDYTDYSDYYYDEGEDGIYEDGAAVNDNEESEDEEPRIIAGTKIESTKKFTGEDEDTISVRAGERLVVLALPRDGWVYVGKEDGSEEGYIPDDIISVIK